MENFIRMVFLLKEVATELIWKVLEVKYHPDDFKSFLLRQKHVLYHLCFNKGRCCACGLNAMLLNQQPIKKSQFDQLFVQQIQNKCQSNVRNHSCTYDIAQNIKVSDLDITLCISIIMNCYGGSLTRQEETNLRDIRQIRNEIAHFQNDVDLTEHEFYRMSKTVASATIFLANNISQDYCNEIQDRIKRLEERKILSAAAEYTECLHEILHWNMQTGDNVIGIREIIERMEANFAGKFDDLEKTLGGRMQRIETNLQDMRLSNVPAKAIYSPIITEKSLSNTQTDKKTPILECREGDDNKSVYRETFTEIEKLRREGRHNERSAMNYSVLVYTILSGSASEDEMQFDVLRQIYKAIYKFSTTSVYSFPIKNVLKGLVPAYLIRIEDSFTSRDAVVDKSVTHSFGNKCTECFLKCCNFEMLLDHVRPGLENKLDDFLGVDAFTLASALIKRMQCEFDDAYYTGNYIEKLIVEIKDTKTIEIFIDILGQCNDEITVDHLLFLLDGLTKNGEDFEIFKYFKTLYYVFHRRVDEHKNTIFHYLVALYNEDKRYKVYIEYFCENRISLLQLKNCYEETAVDFASFLGRFEVIANVVCNMKYDKLLINRILSMVQSGVDILRMLNSSESFEVNISISLDQIILGEKKEYEQILEIIGKESEISRRPVSRKKENKASSEENLQKAMEEVLIDIAGNIKETLNGFPTKIFKTIVKLGKDIK